MNDIQDPPSGEDRPEPGRDSGWAAPQGNGNWTPPPPPPNWAQAGWQDPSAPGAGQPGQPGGAQPPGGRPWGGQHDTGYPGGYPGGSPYWGSPPNWGGWGPGGPGGPGGPTGPGGWYGWSPARPRRSLPSIVTALLLVVAVLVGLGIGHGVWTATRNSSATVPGGNGFGGNGFGGNGSGGAGSGLGNNGTGTTPLSGAAATAANELVDIATTLYNQQGEAFGTGIVLTSDGYILTNNHVISGESTLKATDVATGQTYTGTVVGYDRTHDVALVKLSGASGLKTASIGDSSKLAVDDSVIGIGNAGGVGGTPSAAPGQILALNQSITAQDESNGTSEKLTGLIETNADIQPGDSGGALVNSSGQVIGMDTAASTGFSFANPGNQGFAIPINTAMSIANQIRAGKAGADIHLGDTAFLGVEVDTSQVAANTSGAVVSAAIPNEPAAQAGIGAQDVITALGGATVSSPNDLTDLIGKYHPGNSVSVSWSDPTGQAHQAMVTLAKGPPS